MTHEHFTPCCGKSLHSEPTGRSAIMFNEFNGVVQCHHCGHIYVPGDENAYQEVWHKVQPEAKREATRYCGGRQGNCNRILNEGEPKICSECLAYYDGWNDAMRRLENRVKGALRGMQQKLRECFAPLKVVPRDIPVQTLSPGQMEAIQKVLEENRQPD